MMAIVWTGTAILVLGDLCAARIHGPFLVGLDGSIQISRLSASVSELEELATFAAFAAGPVVNK